MAKRGSAPPINEGAVLVIDFVWILLFHVQAQLPEPMGFPHLSRQRAHRKADRESGLAHRPRLGYTFLAYVSRGKQTQRGREFPQPTAAIGKRGVPALQRVPASLRADAAGEKGRVDRRSRLYGFTRQRPPREAGWYHSSLARHLCQPAPGYRGSPPQDRKN